MIHLLSLAPNVCDEGQGVLMTWHLCLPLQHAAYQLCTIKLVHHLSRSTLFESRSTCSDLLQDGS
jgi:hypothetical protein